MVEIRPFRGITYTPEKFRDLTPVVAPPYDVISQEERKKLIEKSSFNIVNLTLGETDDTGIPKESFYRNAMEKWKKWRADGIVTRAPKPAIWRLDETYRSPDDQTFTRTGFLALIRLEDYCRSRIYRHERTMATPALDRLRLLKATRANFSPVFFVYRDESQETSSILDDYPPEESTEASTNEDNPVEIRLSHTSDREWINRFCDQMKQSAVLIADGHHRYEAALSFHRDQTNDSSLDASFIMGYFVPSSSKGLVIFPVHRGIGGLSEDDSERLEKGISKFFEIGKRSHLSSMRFISRGNKPVPIRLKPEIYENLQERVSPPALASLGVIIFDEIFLKELLKSWPLRNATGEELRYYSRVSDCLSDVHRGVIQTALLLDPMDTETLFSVASAGGILPPKSTYFYPKCLAGLVMHSLEKSW